MNYRYMAIEVDNRVIRGIIDAANEEAAEARLERTGVRVVSIKAAPKTTFIPGLTLTSSKVGKKEITIFSQQLASLLDAGVPLLSGMQLLKDQARTPA